MNRFRHTVSVLSLVMVLLLLAGCLPKAGVTEYTLTVNVTPEGAAEVEGVAEKYKKNAVATFKLIANEGYEFVEWEGDVKPTESDDGQWEIIMDGDKTLTAVFKEIEEEDIEELIAAAEAAIEVLPEVITLEYADQVAEARALVEAVFELDEEAEIEGIEKLEAAEAALQYLSWNPVDKDIVEGALKGVNEDLDLTATFDRDELNLPEELTVGANSYVLIWTTDSPDVVEIEEGKAKITRPEETTTVTLTATLGYDISAQAETKPQSFDFQIKVWGLVPELKSLADAGEEAKEEEDLEELEELLEKFEERLEILVPDYDKNLVAEYMDAIADLLKLETKEELLQLIDAVNTEELFAFNKAVADYFAATTKSDRDTALKDLKEALTGDDAALKGKIEGWWKLNEWDKDFVIDNYLPALRGGVSTIEELQAIINQVNLDVAEELVAGVEANPWSSDDVAEAKAFVEAITESKAAQKALRDRLDAVIAVNTVLNAAEGNMATVLTAQSFENVKEDLNKKYFAAILGDDGFEEGTRVTVADIQAVIDQVNAEHVSYLIGEVVAAAEAELLDTNALNAALTNLKTFVGATVWSDDAASISSEEENLKQYGEAIKEQQPTTVEEIIAIVDDGNTVVKINTAESAEALAGIIWDLKVAEFINLANGSAREDVAGAVMAPDNKPYKSTAEFKAAVVEVVATYLELIEAVETAGNKVDLAEALTAAFEFIDKIDKGDPVAGTMVDNVWEHMAGEDFKGFKSITEIWRVARKWSRR